MCTSRHPSLWIEVPVRNGEAAGRGPRLSKKAKAFGDKLRELRKREEKEEAAAASVPAGRAQLRTSSTESRGTDTYAVSSSATIRRRFVWIPGVSVFRIRIKTGKLKERIRKRGVPDRTTSFLWYLLTTCASGSFSFQNLMELNLRLLNIFKIISFNFCKMFENAKFFAHMH